MQFLHIEWIVHAEGIQQVDALLGQAIHRSKLHAGACRARPLLAFGIEHHGGAWPAQERLR